MSDLNEGNKPATHVIDDQYLINALMNYMPDNIYFKDAQSRFIRVNNSQAAYLGLNSPQEAIGKTDFDFFDEEDAKEAYEDEQRLIRSRQSIIGKEGRDDHQKW